MRNKYRGAQVNSCQLIHDLNQPGLTESEASQDEEWDASAAVGTSAEPSYVLSSAGNNVSHEVGANRKRSQFEAPQRKLPRTLLSQPLAPE